MTQEEIRRGARAETESIRASESGANGGGRGDDFAEAQSEIWDRLQNANRIWLERMQNEATLTAELASKLTASRSFSETATVLQDWTAKHVEMATEDTRRFMTDAQQMMDAGMRFWSKAGERSGLGAGRSTIS